MAISPYIVDYGMGNLASVANAFERLGVLPIVSASSAELQQADAIVLPGVGAFGDAMQRLRESGLQEALHAAVIDRRVPFLGICLGMQLVAERSEEGGDVAGLGWVSAQVKRIPDTPERQVPHVGWNDISFANDEPLFSNVAGGAHYYFDHSYEVVCSDDQAVARVEYGGHEIVAALRQDNIMAVQFHPEKSQNNGLRLFRNFLQHAAKASRVGEIC